MTIIRMLGVDPSLTHTGYAVAEVCTVSRKILRVIEFGTVITAPSKVKQVRRSSDDLARARAAASTLSEVINRHQIKIGVSEIPSGAQSARAALSFGIAIGILASLTIPLIEVSPSEVKMATAGTKVADKEDMVRWAVTLTNETDSAVVWDTSKKANDWAIPHGSGFVVKTMEHQADAICGIQAGLNTEQFRQLAGMLASLIS